MTVERLNKRVRKLEEQKEETADGFHNGGLSFIGLNLVNGKLELETEKEREKRLALSNPSHRFVYRMYPEAGESETEFRERVEQYQKEHPYHTIVIG